MPLLSGAVALAGSAALAVGGVVAVGSTIGGIAWGVVRGNRETRDLIKLYGETLVRDVATLQQTVEEGFASIERRLGEMEKRILAAIRRVEEKVDKLQSTVERNHEEVLQHFREQTFLVQKNKILDHARRLRVAVDMTHEKSQAVLEVMMDRKTTLQHANFGDFHKQLDVLQALALEMEYILKDFMSPMTMNTLRDSDPDLVLAALDQRQCARSIVFRGLIFLGYTSELLQNSAYDWFEGRRLARNPVEMYQFYASIMWPQPEATSEFNPMPRLTERRPVAIRKSFLKNLLQDASWVDNVIYSNKGKDWRDKAPTSTQNPQDGVTGTGPRQVNVDSTALQSRVDQINLRAGGMNGIADHCQGENKTPVFLDLKIFAELTYNFVELNVKQFVDQLMRDYDKGFIEPTLVYSQKDVDQWDQFLQDLRTLLKVSENLVNDVPEEALKASPQWTVTVDFRSELIKVGKMEKMVDYHRDQAQKWEKKQMDEYGDLMRKHILQHRIPFDELPKRDDDIEQKGCNSQDAAATSAGEEKVSGERKESSPSALIQVGVNAPVNSHGNPTLHNAAVAARVARGAARRYNMLMPGEEDAVLHDGGDSREIGSIEQQQLDALVDVSDGKTTLLLYWFCQQGRPNVKTSLKDLVLYEKFVSDQEQARREAGQREPLTWHQEHQQKVLAEQIVTVDLQWVFSPKVVDEDGNQKQIVRQIISEIVPQVISDAVRLAVKCEHKHNIHALAAGLPVEARFVSDLDRILTFDLDDKKGLLASQHLGTSGEPAAYFLNVLEPWSMAFTSRAHSQAGFDQREKAPRDNDDSEYKNTDYRSLNPLEIHGPKRYTAYSLRPAHDWRFSLMKSQILLSKYTGKPSPFDSTADQVDIKERVDIALAEVTRLIPIATELAAEARRFHDMLFNNMPNEWDESKSSGVRVKRLTTTSTNRDGEQTNWDDRSELSHQTRNRISGTILLEDFRTYKDKNRDFVENELHEIVGAQDSNFNPMFGMQDNFKFARMRVSPNPSSGHLTPFANHVVVGVSDSARTTPITPSSANMNFEYYDYPTDVQLEQACTVKDSARDWAAGTYRGCGVHLSAQPFNLPQVYPRPKLFKPNQRDLVLIDLTHLPEYDNWAAIPLTSDSYRGFLRLLHHQANDETEPIVKDGIVQSHLDFTDLAQYHHSIGEYVKTNYDGSIEVEFRPQYRIINPYDPAVETIKKKFPQQYVKIAPTTYLHALAYTNIWDTRSNIIHGIAPSFSSPKDVEAMGRTVNNFQAARELFEELLKHEEIEKALQIPDMHGHTPFEIVIRESGRDALALIPTLEPVKETFDLNKISILQTLIINEMFIAVCSEPSKSYQFHSV